MLAFFESLSRLLQLVYFVKCKRTLFEPNSSEPYSSSEGERNFSRCLFTSSIKREIRYFPIVVVQWRQKNVQKSVMPCRVFVCLFNLLLFWDSRCRRRRHRFFLKSLFNFKSVQIDYSLNNKTQHLLLQTKTVFHSPFFLCLIYSGSSLN